MEKAIFLDRDGVLNEEKDLISKKGQIKILQGVVKALKILKQKGDLLVVITNQPVIARGIISEHELQDIHNHLNNLVGNTIDKFYYCPHHPEMHDDVPEPAIKYGVKCDCRKPQSGMLLRASKELDINLNESWMIGDMISDIVAGHNAGCKTIMVESIMNKTIIKTKESFDTNIKSDNPLKNLLEASNYL